MDILRYILLGVDGVIALLLIVLMILQTDKSDGASGTIVGSSSSEGYFSNNKDRSRDGKLRRTTIISGIAFMILTYIIGLLFLI